jgi:cytochrome c-type biogenesis protein CcmH
VQPDEVLKDPALEQRARDISAGLRCLVCQNQSIDESDAPLAKDLRGRRARAAEDRARANQQVRGLCGAAFGEFVLLRPVSGLIPRSVADAGCSSPDWAASACGSP